MVAFHFSLSSGGFNGILDDAVPMSRQADGKRRTKSSLDKRTSVLLNMFHMLRNRAGPS